MRALLLPAAAALVASCQACPESVDSEDILTSGIYADLTIVAPCTGEAVATAQLTLGSSSNTYVRLTGDDALMAWAGDTSQRMSEVDDPLTEEVHYRARFTARDEDTLYKIAFERTVDEGAPSSRVEVGATSLALLPAGQQLSRASDDFFLSWAAAAQASSVSVTMTGECIDIYSPGLSGDPGTLHITAGTLQTRMVVEDGAVTEDGGAPFDASHPFADRCTVTVTLARSYTGELDHGYGKGGEIQAQQHCSLTFESVP